MSETEHVRSTRVINSGSDQDKKQPQPQPRKSVYKEAGWGHIVGQNRGLFRDSEGKGFITCTDMRRLHKELPLTTEILESVFDSLDLDNNGYLMLGEFSFGFSMFFISYQKGQLFRNDLLFALDQSSGDEQLSENEDDEERHFSMLMEILGVSNVFEDPSEVRSLWAQLRKDEPHLLSNFEEFLGRVTYQIKEARQERKEMEKNDGKPEVDGHSEKDSESVNVVVDVEDVPLDGWPLRRVISIEEDHLPHLLQGDPHLLLHQLREEEEVQGKEEGQANLETSSLYPSNASLKWIKGNIPSSARGQPVGKETLQQASVTSYRLFEVILVENSSVGKNALLRPFCDGQFHSTTAATVGIDYSVRTLNLGDSHVALQLWDTAGQERYRSITKQFFRKADGVVVIYDITMEDSFRSVRPWLTSIQEAVGDPIPVMLLGNKSDKENEREVQTKEADMLAECSAYTGANVLEAMIHLAR
uniref:EF-hand domain-containing protein n=1 Tax=Cyprinus carpio TaxID=7962 RepID=A0A8C2GHW7_CYPCA